MSAGNGIRLRWSVVGAILGAALTLATLFGSGMATWGNDRARLARVESDLKTHLRDVQERMPEMMEARADLHNVKVQQDLLRDDIQALIAELRELTKVVYGIAQRAERWTSPRGAAQNEERR